MATITVWTIETFTVNVDVVVGIQSGVLPDAIASSIQQNVRDFLFPGKLPAGESIYPKALEARIQAIPGVVLGVIDVKLNGWFCYASTYAASLDSWRFRNVKSYS